MSITKYIEKVKARPEEEKRRTVFVWTTGLVFLIFMVWAITFSLSVVNDQADSASLRAEAEASAKTQLAMGTTTPEQKGVSWSADLVRFITSGASSINEGFWTVGSWLHK
ncbi:MAG: hypothetical protein WC640_02320 [Candidatus Paceibacterota bacterium]|jgi:hypothetical protein